MDPGSYSDPPKDSTITPSAKKPPKYTCKAEGPINCSPDQSTDGGGRRRRRRKSKRKSKRKTKRRRKKRRKTKKKTKRRRRKR